MAKYAFGQYLLDVEERRLLRAAKELRPGQATKSGLMVGLGERDEEIEPVLCELREAGVDAVTIGQYLRPTRRHQPVDRYVTPDQFLAYEEAARALGFARVYSGVFVRSSFNAEELHRSGGPR